MDDDISQNAVDIFYDVLKRRSVEDKRKESSDYKIIKQKDLTIRPIKKLLKTLMDNGVHVHSHTKFSVGTLEIDHEPKKLIIYEGESSPHWRPGNSLFIEDPARIEIVITNSSQKSKEGLVVIALTSEHPDGHLLHGPFHDISQACIALAKFLSLNTTHVTGKAN